MRLNVEITKVLYEQVAADALARGRSISDVVRQLLWDWHVENARQRADDSLGAHVCAAKEGTHGQ